jgi:ribonuclease Z
LTGWLFGRERPLPVYGPEGTAAMMGGLERAFEFDVRTRRDVDERLPAAGIEARAKDVAPGIVFERNGLRVTAFAVDHGPVKPAYGYRIDFGGRSAVFSGDTRYSESLVEAARGTDLLVHEVVSPDVERRLAQVRDSARIERIIAHHTTPEEAGRVFAAVRPRLALYTHIVPSPATARDLVPPTRRTYKGPLEVGYDLMMITIGERIEVSKRVVIPDR